MEVTGTTVSFIISISCGCVVQQVVRLAVRLADCCMQLSVDMLWTCCVTSCPTCCKTCCLFYNLLWTCCWLSICCATCCRATTNPQQIEVMEHRACHIASIRCGFVVQLVVQQVEANGVRHLEHAPVVVVLGGIQHALDGQLSCFQRLVVSAQSAQLALKVVPLQTPRIISLLLLLLPLDHPLRTDATSTQTSFHQIAQLAVPLQRVLQLHGTQRFAVAALTI